MNVVTLIGNLATEVELPGVGTDKKVASFVLAVDRANREGSADFVRSRPGTGRPSSVPGPEQTEDGEVIPFEAPAEV